MAASRRSGLLACVTVLVALAACGAPLRDVSLPADGRCDHATPAEWAPRASASLTTAPFTDRTPYDVGGNGAAIRLSPLRCTECSAVRSYPHPRRWPGGPEGIERMADRSFVYDNALFALLRLGEGEVAPARQVLDALAALQTDDGAWGFSFAIADDTFYNVAYQRTGVVAWVLLAMARYEAQKGEGRYVAAMRRAGAWLRDRHDRGTGLLRGGRGRWVEDGARFEPDHAVVWASTEHNIDAYFALREAARVDSAADYLDATALADAIEARLWMPSAGIYGRGWRNGGIDAVVALDAAGTWSALFELARGRPERAAALLKRVDQLLGARVGAWRIWRPGDEQVSRAWFVEASVARALVLHRLGRAAEAAADLDQLARWACAGGTPLLYSSSWAKDFPMAPAVAPTAWFGLVAREVLGGEAWLWAAKPTPRAAAPLGPTAIAVAGRLKR